MKHGFIKVAAVSPRMRVADPVFNADETIKALEEARNAGAKVIVFPELSMTGYSCGDLFLQEMLIRGAEQELLRVQDATAGHDELVMVGMPLEVNGNLYNTAAVLQDGEILAFVPKQFVPNYAEFYEKRHFTPGDPDVRMVPFGDTEVPFGCSILFDVDAVRGLSVEPGALLNDAVTIPELSFRQIPIVKGDAKSLSIAAASVLAKVTRDRMMEEYDRLYPEYGFAKHKGYGTAQHIAALKEHGPCPIHRRTFIGHFV